MYNIIITVIFIMLKVGNFYEQIITSQNVRDNNVMNSHLKVTKIDIFS